MIADIAPEEPRDEHLFVITIQAVIVKTNKKC
jgi:hypothetical protein